MADYFERVEEAGADIIADGNLIVCAPLFHNWDRAALTHGLVLWGRPAGQEEDTEAAYERLWKVEGVAEYYDDADGASVTIELTGPDYAGPVVAWAANTLRMVYAHRVQTMEKLLTPVPYRESRALDGAERERLEERWAELEQYRLSQMQELQAVQ